MKKSLFIISGFIFLLTGLIGVFIPLLPTTPFLLLAIFCWTKADGSLNKIILESKYLGPYVKNYLEGRKTPLKVKIISIIFLWVSLTAGFIISGKEWLAIPLAAIGIGVTWHILKI